MPLEEPSFTAEELAVMDTIQRYPVWEKMMRWVDYQLLCALVDPRRTDVTMDWRKGYLACRAEIGALPKPPAPPTPDSVERTSMQMVDEVEDLD